MKQTKEKKHIGKKSNLDDCIEQIEKMYGKGSIFVYGEGINDNKVSAIKTGSLLLDIATGINGYPRGRITEIYGAESSGKTTLCLHAIAESQKDGGVAAFIDAENALDLVYAQKLGVRINDLLFSQPDYGEQALNIAEKLVDSKSVDIIVIDSVSALVPKSELEGDIGDASIAVQARMMSQALRKLAAKVNKSKTSLIFINQLRSKIGIMFGNPETTSGGNALKFYASMRVDIRKIGQVKSGEEVISNKVKAKIVKNKMAPPYRSAEFEIRFNKGIDVYSEIIDLSIKYGFIEKKGGWFYTTTTKKEYKWNGRENLMDYLSNTNHEKLFLYLRKKITGN